MNRRLQSVPSSAQESNGDAHISSEPSNLLSIEAAQFLGFDRTHSGKARTPRETMRLFREWAARNHVPVLHRGRTLLYERRVLLAFLKLERWTLNRHADTVGVSQTGRKTKTVAGKSLAVVSR